MVAVTCSMQAWSLPFFADVQRDGVAGYDGSWMGVGSPIFLTFVAFAAGVA